MAEFWTAIGINVMSLTVIDKRKMPSIIPVLGRGKERNIKNWLANKLFKVLPSSIESMI